MVFVVETATAFGQATIGRIRFENPWLDHAWLVVEDEAGTWLAGFGIGNADYYFAKPSPLFMKGGQVGSTWNGEATQVVQTGAGLTFKTPAGPIKGASRFLIRYNDGSAQEWTVAPGHGVVACGPTSADFMLQQYTAGGEAGEWVPYRQDGTGRLCTAAGISAIPMDASLTIHQRRLALQPALELGSRFHVSTISWSELEPSPRSISSQRIVDELRLAQESGLEVALTIRSIDSSIAHRPSDLQGLAWDHPQVTARFTQAVSTLLSRLPTPVRWLHIGYEVEPYLHANPGEIAPFRRFVTQVTTALREHTGASIGIVFGFDATKASTAIFRQLESTCDHIAFDYYGLRPQYGFRHVGEESPQFDVPLMRSLAGDRLIILSEAGFASSAEVNGGQQAQAQFFRHLLKAIEESDGQIAAVNIWAMNDMPAAIVEQVLNQYGLYVPGALPFMSTLGLRSSAGVEKPSHATIRDGFQRMGQQALCGQ